MLLNKPLCKKYIYTFQNIMKIKRKWLVGGWMGGRWNGMKWEGIDGRNGIVRARWMKWDRLMGRMGWMDIQMEQNGMGRDRWNGIDGWVEWID